MCIVVDSHMELTTRGVSARASLRVLALLDPVCGRVLLLCAAAGSAAATHAPSFRRRTLAALSFLDNGLEMIQHGLTFWVGIGFVIGWTLKLLSSLVDEVWEPYFVELFKPKGVAGAKVTQYSP